MAFTNRSNVTVALAAVLMAIFLVSLPGFGIETRKTTDYSAWAGPVFLILTLLVFALGVAAIMARKRATGTLQATAGSQAAVAVLLNLLDFSGVGGPRPPPGPLVLGVSAIVIAILELAAVLSIPPTDSPPPAG